MDYLQIYKEEFNRTLGKLRSKLIEDFKLAKQSKRNFLKIFNKTNDDLYNQANSMIDELTRENMTSCYDLFLNRRQEYDKNLSEDEVISLIFENEIKNEVTKLGKLDYPTIIRKLASHRATILIHSHFADNDKYYKLVYEQEKFDLFFEEGFENKDFEASKEYAEMFKIKYPESLNPLKVTINETHKIMNEDLSSEEKRYIARIDKFTLKEKYFLLAVLHNSIGSNNKDGEVEYQYEKLPIGEYLRIIAITKDLINNDIFYKDLGKISIYTELKKKHKLINKYDYDVFIFDLNKKLKDLKLPSFKKFLEEFLFKK